jgi:hypothetical protein
MPDSNRAKLVGAAIQATLFAGVKRAVSARRRPATASKG